MELEAGFCFTLRDDECWAREFGTNVISCVRLEWLNNLMAVLEEMGGM